MTEEPEPTALYHIFGEVDLLLYIGISNNFGTRWKNHAKAQPWWGEHRRMTVDWLASRPEAEAAEKAAIKAEKPRYNIVHNGQVRPRTRKLPETLPLAARMPDRRGGGLRLLSPEDMERWEPLAVFGGFNRLRHLPVPEDGSPELTDWAGNLGMDFLRSCGRGVRKAREDLALIATIEQMGVSARVLSLARDLRRMTYRQTGLPCPRCKGVPPISMTCGECGTEGKDGAQVPHARLPVLITGMSNGPLETRLTGTADAKAEAAA